MESEDIPGRARQLGRRLLNGLQQALHGHPDVLAVRGQGLMVGIELNRNCQDLVGRALAQQRLLITVTRESTIDRKSTRLNSSHLVISYAVFCLKKKKLQ